VVDAEEVLDDPMDGMTEEELQVVIDAFEVRGQTVEE